VTLLRVDRPLRSPAQCTLCTRKGWPIPEEPESLSENLLFRDADGWRRKFAADYPLAKFRSESSLYNCVGMVFASRRVWIDIKHVYKILADDGYREIQRQETELGDVVLYEFLGQASHVGVIVDIHDQGNWRDFRVMSKWGDAAEYIHPIDALPEALGTVAGFYTDRSEL
jgi:hypothetical protein